MNVRFVWLLSACHLLTDINQGAVAALLPFLITSHHLSYTAAAGVVFAVNISSTIVQPLFGHFADRLPSPWLMPVGIFLSGFGLALTGIVPTYELIIMLAMVSGIGIAAYHPEGARFVSIVAGNKKATAMSIFGIGGTLGFAIGPVFITSALLILGLQGTLVLAVPVIVMASIMIVLLPRFSSFEKIVQAQTSAKPDKPFHDEWGPFSLLTIIVICRSVLFYSLYTFIPLYWIHVLHQSKAVGSTALTIMAAAGIIGNLAGGKLADRFGHVTVIRSGFCFLIPFLPILLWTSNVYFATLILLPLGFILSVTYSPIIVLGHTYLPNHVGLSSGVTLGIAIAIGGAAAPLLGKIADYHGIWVALASIALLPAITAAVTFTMPHTQKISSNRT